MHRHSGSTYSETPLPVFRPSTSPDAPSFTSSYRRPSESIVDKELLSSADEILHQCPRFRILVLGKSGAGKSSVINAAFEVEIANVSHDLAGVSNIHDEITSDANPRFVLHDSQGFAAGETANFQTVKDFIALRTSKPDIKDKLHAIWFCMEVPTENAALFEIADQDFLNLDLHEVPVIVVFTKYDLLVSKFEKEADYSDESMDDNAFEAMFAEQAKEAYDRMCVQPLLNATKYRNPPIPYTTISSRPQYKHTLADLVALTQEHIDQALWLIWALAQRTNADMKIQASIEVGKKKYWKGLASSLSFSNRELTRCLDTIHKDIVTVWNFNDPSKHLNSTEFKALITHLVADLIEERSAASRMGETAISSVSGVMGVVAAVMPVAAPVALPIALSLVFAQWVFMVYQQTPNVLRGLMGYIIDLTIVMQNLFWVMQAQPDQKIVKTRHIKLALNAYKTSSDWSHVHEDIRGFVTNKIAWTRGNRDLVLDKVVSLIERKRFVPPESYRMEIDGVLADDDEDRWTDPH